MSCEKRNTRKKKERMKKYQGEYAVQLQYIRQMQLVIRGTDTEI